MLLTLELAPVPWRWSATELGIDAIHHAVYAATTGAVSGAREQW